jgi:hypothetical protein
MSFLGIIFKDPAGLKPESEKGGEDMMLSPEIKPEPRPNPISGGAL